MHLIALHDTAGSSNPLGVSGNYDRITFAPYYLFKDLVTIFIFIFVLSVFVFFIPNYLGDSENYIMANPMQTPAAIVPEWYLLPFYAILRSIPNKLLGVITMFGAILAIMLLPVTDLGRSKGLQFRPLSKIAFFIFVTNFIILMKLGACHVESPFIELGQISTMVYFGYFLFIVPFLSLIENTLIDISFHSDNSTIRGADNYPQKQKVGFNGLSTKRFYSTRVEVCDNLQASSINPWFITGFVDAEGSFSIKLSKNSSYRTGWKSEFVFSIGLHEKDLFLLKAIQSYFGGIGSVITHKTGASVQFRVSSKEQLALIFNHFNSYPLISQKFADFKLFEAAFDIYMKNGHLTIEGLQEIVNIRASLNEGLSDTLKESFPNTIPVARPLVENAVIPHSSWLAGFTSGEGCFFVNLRKGTTKVGFRVDLAFIITQHLRDITLLESIASYLDCGTVTKPNKRNWGQYRCENFTAINTKILPLFKEHPILGVKALDFEDWSRVVELMSRKAHLTEEGIAAIREIKSRMNTGRLIKN